MLAWRRSDSAARALAAIESGNAVIVGATAAHGVKVVCVGHDDLLTGRDTRRVVSAVAAVQRWARVWCNT
jgi:hypothetical protein